MGLLCQFSFIDDLGYPSEVSGGDETIGEESVMVDYSNAVEVFIETFLSVANELVPVRTGYLRSTIKAGGDDCNVWCEATADYAQYVEYGTSYMEAQPYFEPALMEALEASMIEVEIAIEEAQEELEAILTSLMESAFGLAGGGGGGMAGMSWGQFFGGLAIFAIMFLLLFPILVNVYAILDTLNVKVDGGRGGGGGLPEVIIT